jgi:hypothetical protein
MPASEILTFKHASPTKPGMYAVRGPDIQIPKKVLIYLDSGRLWLHRVGDRSVADVPFDSAVFPEADYEWTDMPTEWITNSPNAPAVQVGDVARFPDGERRMSGYVAEKGPGWLRIHYGPTIPTSFVIDFVPRHGAPIPTGTTGLPLNHF